ncbi:glycosyltransferase family 4 protein (plasmid) [Pseudanabaena biceps]|nr:glycosyltransferase family 4 protein [Pseudanabaena biceps]
MRIGIDVTCWSNRRGYGRFTRGLIQALLEANTEDEFILFVDAHTFAKSQFPKQAACVVVATTQAPTEAASASGQRSLKDLWAMMQAVNRCPLDVLFFPSVYTYFPVITKATIILGVHDVIAEDYPELIFPQRRGRWLWNLKGWLAHHQSDFILTVSNHAKNGIVRHFQQHTSDRIWVIDEAPDPIFRTLAATEIDWKLLSQYGISHGDRILLYVGGINPHKNLGMLIESLAVLHQEDDCKDVRLVIVGDIKTDVFTPGLDKLKTQISLRNLEKSVHFTGFIPDADIVHFFNASQAVVLPSFAEGFGLPAIEGAACGAPVVATRNSPLPDLLEGGGLFIDPTDPDHLTQALRQILNDEDGRCRMATIALAKARQFTWQRSAQQMQAMLAILDRTAR